jgi:16S rRNA processing protein RimM
MANERFEVGVITKPHGLKGGLEAHLFDPDSAALAEGRTVTLVLKTGPRAGALVDDFRIVESAGVPGSPGRVRLVLEGIDDRNAAERLRGCGIEVARADLPALDEGEFYVADTIGLFVHRRLEGGDVVVVGKVVGLVTSGPQDLLEVRYRDRNGRARTWLLPVAAGFVVDVTDVVLVELPDGFLPDDLEARRP